MRAPVFRGFHALPGELRASVRERFYRLVDKSGPIPVACPERGPCWTWTGCRGKRADGALSYGRTSVQKRSILAHRLSWEMDRGEIASGLVVCHHCDNPGCVRPEHLFLGTQAQNLEDMRAKGRGRFNRFPTGTAHPNAKVDETRVAEILNLRASGLSLAKIGQRVDLHPTTVHDIVRGKTWKKGRAA